jgi:hypothetical protein
MYVVWASDKPANIEVELARDFVKQRHRLSVVDKCCTIRSAARKPPMKSGARRCATTAIIIVLWSGCGNNSACSRCSSSQFAKAEQGTSKGSIGRAD